MSSLQHLVLLMPPLHMCRQLLAAAEAAPAALRAAVEPLGVRGRGRRRGVWRLEGTKGPLPFNRLHQTQPAFVFLLEGSWWVRSSLKGEKLDQNEVRGFKQNSKRMMKEHCHKRRLLLGLSLV